MKLLNQRSPSPRVKGVDIFFHDITPKFDIEFHLMLFSKIIRKKNIQLFLFLFLFLFYMLSVCNVLIVLL